MKNILKKLKIKKVIKDEEKIEKEIDLVVHKISMGIETTTKDLQVYLNYSEQIEKKLQKLLKQEERKL